MICLEIRGAAMEDQPRSSVVARSVEDCDRWLAVLRISVRRGSVYDREVARVKIDQVLDRRLELVSVERSRMGAQS